MQLRFRALIMAASASVAVSAAAQAQDTTPPAAATTAPPAAAPADNNPPAATTTPAEAPRKSATEDIVVTGTRVRRKDLTTPAPVTVINREQIQSSGVASIGDFLQLLPAQGGATNTNVNNGGDGETQISLRNLGSNRTLVLVDGKRMVNGGVGAGSAVDLNTIPTADVERVEVLKDGASAVYGSDAIAGVVNIITRKKIDGVEMSAYGGTSQHGDAYVYDLSLLAGAASDHGSFVVGAGYFNQDPMFASQRGWATNALSWDFPSGVEGTSGSGTTPKTRVNALDPNACSAKSKVCADLASTFAVPTGSKLNLIFDPGTTLKNADGWRLRNASIDAYNYQAVNYLVTPSQRFSLFSNGEYHMDWARAYYQATYVNRQSVTLVAAEPFTSISSNVNVAANNLYNPFATSVAVQKRLTDLPQRGDSIEVGTARVVAGLDGTLPEATGPLAGWFWDISMDYGRTSGSDTSQGFLNTVKTGPGLGASFRAPDGTPTCGTAAAPIDNCTPVDIFGPPGTLTPAMQQQLGAYQGTNYGVTQLFVAAANVSGELFNIAADRPISLALGYEHRNEYGAFINNPILAGGFDSDTGNPGPTNTVGHFYVNEGYAEIVAPIINHVPFAEDLEFQGAVRVFDYNTFGSDATYKLGARWSPIRDVTIRGTYGTGFRAPNIVELYQGQTGGNFESSNDPCAATKDAKVIAACGPAANNGQTVAQINSISGGNSALQPEKAKMGTVGVVLEPSMVRGLTVTADFYTITLTSLVATYGTQLILNKCYGVGSAQDTSFCSLVQRDPGTQGVSHVTDLASNVGGLSTSGIDLAAQYSLPTEFGRFLIRFDSTYLLTYDTTLPDGTLIHGVSNYDGGGSVAADGSGNFNPRLKFNAGVNYSIAGLTAGLTGRFISGFTECSPDGGLVSGANTGPGFCYQQSADPTGTVYPQHKVSSQMTFDLLLAYNLKSGFGNTTVAVGVRNLLNQDPPRVYDSFLTYADPAYDFVGRFFFGRIDHKF